MEVLAAVNCLAALAQDSRLSTFRLLVRRSPDGMPAGEIAHALDILPATLSFHLKELVHAGLLDRRRESRSIIYSVNVDVMRSLLGFLIEDCCDGRPELCQPDFAESACCDQK